MKRVAVVTGGADGIGKEIVREFLKEEYMAVALDVDRDKLKQFQKECGSDLLFAIGCNILEERSIKDAFSEIDSKLGRVDVLVNNAGGSLAISQPLDQIDVKDWEKVIDLNLRGTFLCTKEAAIRMRRQHYGRIINMSSMAGRSRSVFGGVPYAAAKAGIIGLTRQSSKDLGPLGITINAIAPGTVMSGDRIHRYWENKTEEEKQRFFSENPSGRLGEPKDIARAVLFLADEGASFINGAVLDINGGMWVG